MKPTHLSTLKSLILPESQIAEKGVLLIVSCQDEWVLPWWKINYLVKNTMPVAFVDLGLSEKARAWCKNVGHVVDLPEIPKELQKESIKKLALAFSPFKYTIYVESHMQIKTSLSPLFNLAEKSFFITAKSEEKEDSGFDFLIFEKTDLFLLWTLSEISDQEILSHTKTSFVEKTFNWRVDKLGDNLFAGILNRKGESCKKEIRNQIKHFEEKYLIKIGMFA